MEEINKVLMSTNDIILRGKMAIVTINGENLVVFEDGTILRSFRNLYLKSVKNVKNDTGGYNEIGCNKKMFKRHRIIAHAFLGFDINNTKMEIDHIDGNRINNNLKNLRIVNRNQNQWNRTKAKGYYWSKLHNKYKLKLNVIIKL